MSTTPILLDCDPGHDDAIAILLALASPEVDLLGVTTVAGNQTLEKTTANAIRVLDHIGRPDVPVAAGAGRPLLRTGAVAADVHGETGLAGKLVADLYGFYARFHRREYGWAGAPVHDAVALAHVIDATLLSTAHCGVVIDTGPEPSRGRTHADVRGRMGWTPNCHVAT